jgi:hypothetical protein
LSKITLKNTEDAIGLSKTILINAIQDDSENIIFKTCLKNPELRSFLQEETPRPIKHLKKKASLFQLYNNMLNKTERLFLGLLYER